MANTKPTKRLIEKKIVEVTKEVSDQKKIVDRLQTKLTSIQGSYDTALGRLNSMKSELKDYKKDKVK